jgi:hypothetical protein
MLGFKITPLNCAAALTFAGFLVTMWGAIGVVLILNGHLAWSARAWTGYCTLIARGSCVATFGSFLLVWFAQRRS